MRTRILSLFALVFVLVAAKQTIAQGTAFIYHGQKQAAEIQELKQRLEKLEALIQQKTGGRE